jgi:predicted esterase
LGVKYILKKHPELIILIILFTLLTSTIPINATLNPQHIIIRSQQLEYNEEYLNNRQFLWQTPTTPPPINGYPVLFLLHGATQYAETWFYHGQGGLKGSLTWGKRQTAFTHQALKQGYMVIAPDSQRHLPFGPKAWNSNIPTLEENSDLQFIKNIIHWTQNHTIPINNNHICCIGFSSGGYMTSRIGLTLGSYFKALAIHSGAHADTLHPSPQDTSIHPPTLIIHGMKDQMVPAKFGISLYHELKQNNISTHLLLNPWGRHIWQPFFNNTILDWFTYGSYSPQPPTQPTTGIGSTNYTHKTVITSTYGKDEYQFWLFEPANPKPSSAPVIVFNHGWGAQNPSTYQAWINHIVKQGNIVIYPRYQKTLVFGYKRFTDNAITAVQNALEELQKSNHVTPELDKFAITGHSLGGGITAYMAARAIDSDLPIPKAIMPVQPALPFGDTADLTRISNGTYMLVIVGANDTIVYNRSAVTIFYNATQISYDQKDYIIQISDSYGFPPLLADHGAPTCAYNNSFLPIDGMDYYSTWKLFDALTDYAFYGINKEYCFDNTSEQRFMGLWSDGTSVAELIVTDSP